VTDVSIGFVFEDEKADLHGPANRSPEPVARQSTLQNAYLFRYGANRHHAMEDCTTPDFDLHSGNNAHDP
jgi:hypothetical protein